LESIQFGKKDSVVALDFRIDDRMLDDGTPVVAVAGEIDLFTAPEFKRHVQRALDHDGQRLVVDLSETTFVDSSSLGVLIGAHRRLAEEGEHPLVVVAAERSVLKTLRITGLDGLFTVVDTLADASARVRA
jgi:anti-sigma B factor antagonist